MSKLLHIDRREREGKKEGGRDRGDRDTHNVDLEGGGIGGGREREAGREGGR